MSGEGGTRQQGSNKVVNIRLRILNWGGKELREMEEKGRMRVAFSASPPRPD